MEIDNSLIENAISFLRESGDREEIRAADVLRTCRLDDYQINTNWRQYDDGVMIYLAGPRKAREVINGKSKPIIGRKVKEAFSAVLPNKLDLIGIQVAVNKFQRTSTAIPEDKLSLTELRLLVEKIEGLKDLMTSAAIGILKIEDKNQEYIDGYAEVVLILKKLGIEDPHPHPDLWEFLNYWNNNRWKGYKSKELFLSSLYQPLLDGLYNSIRSKPFEIDPPTGWTAIDRRFENITKALETAQHPEDFQAIGTRCREAIKLLARAVYKPEIHEPLDDTDPGRSDSRRMLEAYIQHELEEKSHTKQRKLTQASVDLTSGLLHKDNADFRDAALCVEATRSLINAIAIIAGRRDPE
ncbi:MAG: hypothetical protein ISN29_07055 [Gammaproteobacteria bacterium AqS3]|nr:hypothetical protein [Gammaproteobacteria bacterium AqS3]